MIFPMIGLVMFGRWLGVIALGTMLAFAANASEPVAADPAAGKTTSADWWTGQIDSSGFKPAKRGEEWWRKVVAQNPSCGVLSDGCQTCFAGADSFTCSNPGFSCVANEQWSCAGVAPLARSP